MSRALDFDIGPLTWVRGEIDQALERALASLRGFAATPGEAAQIRAAQTHFHQAHGALAIVGLDGVTRLSEEIEAFIGDLQRAGGPPAAEAVKAIERAIGELSTYLGELLGGAPNQPLKLYPAYRDLAAARGRDAPDPVDLYYPDLSPRPPKRDRTPVTVTGAAAQAHYREQRARYQRGLLKLIRKDASGGEDMRAAVVAIEAAQVTPAHRAFWWAALGFFDALVARALPDVTRAQRVCNRIEQQMKRLIEGSPTVAERLMRETLYQIAAVRPATSHLRDVQDTYRLQNTVPESLERAPTRATPQAALSTLRDLLAAAKSSWNKYTGGHPAVIGAFREQVGGIRSQAAAIDHHDLRTLGAALADVGAAFAAHPQRASDAAQLEVATTLLLMENAVARFDALTPELHAQSAAMAERLAACARGEAPKAPPEVPLLDESTRRAQERALMGQVVGEIRASLRAIEQTLDTFFREPDKRADLPGLEKPLKQAQGALEMLNEPRAAAVLGECTTRIRGFAAPEYVPQAADFESIAAILSGLGFYVDALEHGSADFDAAMQPIAPAQLPPREEVGGPPQPTPVVSVEAELAQAKKQVGTLLAAWRDAPGNDVLRNDLAATLRAVHKDAALVADARLEQQSGEALAKLADRDHGPGDPSLAELLGQIAGIALAPAAPSEQTAKLAVSDAQIIDAELLAIFLEEATEVLETIHAQLAVARTQPRAIDVLRTIRRCFHTLKGSGRMVGLTRIGEGAWGVEQVMNRWLEEERTATPDLFALVDFAHRYFAAAVAALKAGGGTPDEAAVVGAADRLRRGEPLGALVLPFSEAAAPPVRSVAAAAPAEPRATTSAADTVAPDVAVSRDTSEPALAAADPDALNTPTVAPGLASRLAVAPAAESAQAEVAAIVVGDAAGDALTASAGPGERAGVESMPVGPSQPIDVEAEAATLDFAAADVVPVAAEAREPDMPSLDFSMPLPVASAATEAPAQGLGTDIPLATTGEASPAQHAEGMTPDGDAAAPDGHPAAPDAHDALSLDFSMPLPSPLVSAVPEAHAEPAAAETPLVEEVVRIGTLELSPTLFNVFVVEAQAHLATLAEEALALASGEPASQRLQRAAHTLAGIAGTVHIDALRELGHALELAVGRLGAARVPAAVAAIVSESVAELDRMAAAARDLRVPAHVPELVARLDAIEGEEGVAISDATSEVDATTAPDAASSTATAQAQAADSAAAATPAAIAMASGQPAESENAPASVPVDAALAATGHVPTTPAVPGTGGAESQVIVDSMPTDRRERRIHDDLDRELLPIFLEEAAELVPAVGQALRDWRAHPDHPAIGHALQRSLHTLKGSARMCGAMSLGELTHAMESRIENALALSALPMALLDELEASYDRMSLLHDRLLDPDAEPLPEPAPTARADAEAANGVDPAAPSAATAPVTPVPPATAVDAGTRAAEPASPTSAATSTERPAPREATAPPPEAGDGAARAMLRVRAEMIDRLVNEAGEIAIARSRIDGEMRALKGALGDLTENVTRLRGQLREVEIQAESQMASRLTVAQERDTSFDPLEFDRFTRFQELTRMMAESVNDVQTVHQNIIKALDESDAALSAQARLNRELQQSLMRIRMVPFQSVAERLYRVVRQAAKDLDKRAVLDIRGAQVELDRSVLERITAPFEHLLRNSVAHGIEKPADRVAAGKKELGEIRIELRQEGNEVMMAATDDGAGIDLDRVRAKAVAQGLIAPDAQLSDKETADLVFHSGFSTATEVSQIAGRGVGMDVVKSEVQALGGRVEIATQRGKGARFTIYLPLTLAVTQAVLVRAGGAIYAVPSALVEQVRQLKEPELQGLREQGTATWQERQYPFRYLPRLLGDGAFVPEPRRLTPVLYVRSGAHCVALQLDEVIGNQEIVVKNAGPLLSRIAGITGATVLGSGRIVLILNPVILADRVPAATLAPAAAPVEPEPALPTVMVVDDSLTVRKITGRLLAREGYHVVTAKDGVDAMEQLQDLVPDAMLVDIEMPRMDGFDLTRNVRNDRRLKQVPIVMITSRTAEKHRTTAKEIGVDVFLGKPYQEEELLGHIAGFVRKPVAA